MSSGSSDQSRMVDLKRRAGSLLLRPRMELQGAGSGDDDLLKRAGSIMADCLSPPNFCVNALLEQRITLLERLAECANEIKRIDEQLKLI